MRLNMAQQVRNRLGDEMKNDNIPSPRTSFFKVKCACGNTQNVFSNASTKVNCLACEKPLLKTGGGKAKILAKKEAELK